MPSASRVPSTPRIHEAARSKDGSGVIFKGAELDESAAIERRRKGLDIVVCGNDLGTNRALARTIEGAVGPWMRQTPHTFYAGPFALPHFQQRTPPPVGHTFYETPNRKVRNR